MTKTILAVLLALSLAPLASAGAEPQVQHLPSFGIDVPTAQALKTVIPAGWQVTIEPGFILPKAVSWSMGEPWTHVVEMLGPTRVSWDARSVVIGRGEGTTPLVIRPAVQPVPVEAPMPVAGQAYVRPVAFEKPMARAAARSIAEKYKLVLRWVGPDFQLAGPVTLLGNSAEQDIALLNTAIGLNGPMAVQLDATDGEVLAMPRASMEQAEQQAAHMQPAVHSSPSEEVAATAPRAGPPISHPAALVRLATAVPAEPVHPLAPAKFVAPVPALTLKLSKGEPLETALNRFIASQGFHLDWKVAGGYRTNSDASFTGSTMEAVLAEVLPPLKLSANAYTQSKQVVIYPASPEVAQ